MSYCLDLRENELNRLLHLFKTFYVPPGRDYDYDYDSESDNDMFSGHTASAQEQSINNDIEYFRTKLLPSIRKRKLDKDGKKLTGYVYLGDKMRAENIHFYEFYQSHIKNMPILGKIIIEILGQPEASHSPEKVFSRCKFVISDYRTCLITERAEKLILSSCRYAWTLFGSSMPKLPTLGT